MKQEKFTFAFTTDVLIFSIDSRNNDNCRGLPKKYFSILLVKRKKEPFINTWCLPGGFVEKGETSDEASKRILKKETNLNNVYMEQLYTFDDINRDPRGRVISTSYMSLIDKSLLKDELSEDAKWFDISIKETSNSISINLSCADDQINIKLQKEIKNNTTNEYDYKLTDNDLAFDHALIVNKGVNELRKKISDTDIVFNLMPKEFTIGELKQVYELILGKKLINSAFRRVIAKKVIATNNYIKTGGHRPSCLFKYNGKL